MERMRCTVNLTGYYSTERDIGQSIESSLSLVSKDPTDFWSLREKRRLDLGSDEREH